MSPTEQILPLALSGAEIKAAILDKIKIALNKDCNLNDNLAYSGGFSFEVSITVRAQDFGREIENKTDVNGAMKVELQGDREVLVPADPREYEALDAAEAHISMTATDPTAARIESGQEVPIRVTDKQGKDEIRHVKYRRDALDKK